MKKEDQKVLVVPTQRLFPDGVWQGFRQTSNPAEILKLVTKFGQYRRRGDMEKDPSWKQIIPQIVLVAGDKLFIHRIPTSGSESRLHDLWPIFLGGHIEESDFGIEEAADREFREEILYFGNIIRKEFVGIVNLQNNAVNSVHAGLVWAYIGDSERFRGANDDGVIDGQFVTWQEAEKMSDKMSYWSKEAFPALKAKFGRVKILPK